MSELFDIVDSRSAPLLLREYQAWVESHWHKQRAFTGKVKNKPVPSPLLAVAQETLAGGVGFTGHAQPDRLDIGLWINTLYVAPAQRRKGIASALVLAAVAECQQEGFARLCVYTDVPLLYTRLGWQKLSDGNGHSVMEMHLT